MAVDTGSGDDGAQTAAMLIARAAISEGFEATHNPSYGPESRGGTSYADVHVAETEGLNPGSPEPLILILLAELVRFIQQPRCLGMQSDGFPCGTPHTSCGECRHIL